MKISGTIGLSLIPSWLSGTAYAAPPVMNAGAKVAAAYPEKADTSYMFLRERLKGIEDSGKMTNSDISFIQERVREIQSSAVKPSDARLKLTTSDKHIDDIATCNSQANELIKLGPKDAASKLKRSPSYKEYVPRELNHTLKMFELSEHCKINLSSRMGASSIIEISLYGNEVDSSNRGDKLQKLSEELCKLDTRISPEVFQKRLFIKNPPEEFRQDLIEAIASIRGVAKAA